MIAIKRLQSIMWILVVAMGALAAYLISLQVATERNSVRHMIDQIRWTRADIRYLEAEFGARASMRQLAAWNDSDLRLYVPAPAQYLPNERALANLDRMTPVTGGYAPPPVMTAMASRDTDAEDAATTKVEDAAAGVSSEFALIRTASAAEARAVPTGAVATSRATVDAPIRASVQASATASPKTPSTKFIKPAGEPDPVARKAARLALLDGKLLGGPALSEAQAR